MNPQNFLYILFILLVLAMSQIFEPFLKSILLALLLSIGTYSIKTFVSFKLKNKIGVSFAMTLGLGLLFFVPLVYFIFTFTSYINTIKQDEVILFYNNFRDWIQNIPEDFVFLKVQINQLLEQLHVGESIKDFLSLGAYIGKNSAQFLFDMTMILIFYFFFNYYSLELTKYTKELLPLKTEDSNELFFETSNVMNIVFYTILITAIFQGVLFGYFVSFYGYDGILFGVLYGFASLIPIVGGVIMWAPLSIYELMNGSVANAISIALYTIIVISIIADTFIKPIIIKYINKKIVKTPTKINELLIFFSIVAGLSTFGFWGVIIGPAFTTIFLSILQLLKKYRNISV